MTTDLRAALRDLCEAIEGNRATSSDRIAAYRALADATPATVGTVGGLLGSHPIVEWRLGEDWHQARIAQRGSGLIKGAEMRWRHHRAPSWSSWGQPWGDPGQHMDEPARLVPEADADADPSTRGPLPQGG